jgi:hypothetical protein
MIDKDMSLNLIITGWLNPTLPPASLVGMQARPLRAVEGTAAVAPAIRMKGSA